MAQQDAATDDDTSGEIDESDVGFIPDRVARSWESADELTVATAATLAKEFTEADIRVADGEQSDRDVVFTEASVLVEEKAIGVCSREVAQQHAPLFIELRDRERGVLALNPHQIFEGSSRPN